MAKWGWGFKMPQFTVPQVDATDITDQSARMCLLPDGRVAVVWFHRDDSAALNRVLGVRVFEADGTAVTDELIVDALPGTDTLPSITAISSTQIGVVWANFGGAVEAYGRVYTISGNSLSAGPVEPISNPATADDNGIDIETATLPNGNIIAVWVEAAGDFSSARVVARTFDSDLNPLSGIVQISETTLNTPQGLNINVVGSHVTVAWMQNGADTLVHGRGFAFDVNADGTMPPLIPNDTEIGTHLGIQDIVQLANGDILVVFNGGPVQGGTLDDNDKLSGRIYSSDFQTVVKNTFQINDDPVDTGTGFGRAVAFEGGGFGIFWSQIPPGGGASSSAFEAYQHIYDSGYNSTGQTRLTNDGEGQFIVDAVRTSASGDVMLLWEIANARGGRTTFGSTYADLDPDFAPLPSIAGLDGDAASFTEGGSVILDSGADLVIDSPSGNIASASVSVSDFQAGDVLSATTSGGVVQSYSNGVLTLSGVASAAVYQAILRSIAYSFSGDDPNVGGSDATRSISFSITDVLNAVSTPVGVTVSITAADDVAVARDDAVGGSEATALVTGDVFADNGSGADSDPDSALAVTAVNSVTAAVGTQVTLASGALLLLNANGTFSYNQNGAFDHLPGAGSGAVTATGQDSFTYTLAGGDTATVTLTFTGIDSEGDVVDGDSGANTLNGGIGADIMVGAAGADTYTVDNVADLVDESGGAAGQIDRVFSSVSVDLTDASRFAGIVEAVQLMGSAALNVTGNAVRNYLTGTTGDNLIDGGAGADAMWGRGGNDTYVVDNAADLVDESIYGANGTDTILSSVSFNLGRTSQGRGALENLTLTGADNINAAGNSLANVMIGNAGANIVAGGLGNDTLTGGGSNDIFLFNGGLDATTNVDTINDMNEAGNDTIWLDDAIFAMLAAGRLAAGAFRIGTAAADADDRIVYNSTNGQLIYDANGSAADGATLFAILDPSLALTAADFFVV
jgi:hypothetical protein